jgi:hypothetical protein
MFHYSYNNLIDINKKLKKENHTREEQQLLVAVGCQRL